MLGFEPTVCMYDTSELPHWSPVDWWWRWAGTASCGSTGTRRRPEISRWVCYSEQSIILRKRLRKRNYLQNHFTLLVRTLASIHEKENYLQKSRDTASWKKVKLNSFLFLKCHALSEKQSKFPQYNMKCRGKPDTTWNIPRSITFSPVHFMLYRGKSITVGTVHGSSW